MRSLRRYLKAFWQLLRLEHGLMYGFGVLIGLILGGETNLKLFILGFLTALFFQASTFAMNDYLDYEVDLANKRFDRPLVRGDISRKAALVLSILLFPFGCVTAFFISIQAFIFAFLISTLGYLYNYKLKELGFVGNIYIAFTMSAPFIFGGIISNLTVSILILSLIAFFCGLGREVMKGIEDVEGDAIRSVRSIARLFGTDFAAKIASTFFLISILLSFLPPMLIPEFFDVKYLLPILATDIILLQVVFSLRKSKEISKFRKKTLLAIFLGLIGFLGGAF